MAIAELVLVGLLMKNFFPHQQQSWWRRWWWNKTTRIIGHVLIVADSSQPFSGGLREAQEEKTQ